MYLSHQKVKQNKKFAYENAYLAGYIPLKYVYCVLSFDNKDIHKYTQELPCSRKFELKLTGLVANLFQQNGFFFLYIATISVIL